MTLAPQIEDVSHQSGHCLTSTHKPYVRKKSTRCTLLVSGYVYDVYDICNRLVWKCRGEWTASK